MAAEAERLLQGSGWLPEILRTDKSRRPCAGADGESTGGNAAVADDADLPAFLADVENDGADDPTGFESEEPEHSAIAAE